MQTTRSQKVGSLTALLIGFPLGIGFSLLILFCSLTPFFSIYLFWMGGKLFWQPLVSFVMLPLLFAFLLWKGGRRIGQHLDKKYSILKTSFYFILFVNSWLYVFIYMVFLAGTLWLTPDKSSLLFATAATAIMYITTTILSTFTIGLIITAVTKSIIRHKR